jgi:WASH complex subunit strumpellin
MSDFETSGAGKTLLRLVARGNAIIAEILRLSAHIPQPFQMRTQDAIRKYGRIVVDFAYLDRTKGRGPDFYEEAIDKDEVNCHSTFLDRVGFACS